MNPIEEFLNGLYSQQHPSNERAETWRDRMSEVARALESGDEAMLIVCRNGRTRIVKSDNGSATKILKRAVYACDKLNIN